MSCYKYWDKIAKISESILSYGNIEKEGLKILDKHPTEEFTKILNEIEIIAHDKEINFDSAKHILDDERMNKALILIRKFYLYLSVRLETENALKILNAENPNEALDSFHFYEKYIGLINNERQLAKFDENKTFVFLGSGPLPLTLIMFNLTTKCKCIGIEQNKEIAELSRKVLNTLGLNKDIEIITGNEESLVDLKYDILMIAAFAEPKKRVFSNVWKYVDEKTPILYRTYSGMRAILYSPVTEEDTVGFQKERMMLPKGTTNNTSVLIKKIDK